MSYHISDEPEKSLDFTPEHHYVGAVDAPGNQAGDPAGAKSAAQEIQEDDSHESAAARKGAAWAMDGGSFNGHSAPFNSSVGLHSTGPDHSDCFERAIRDSGGVRQGDTWVSDPAPGVQRVVSDHTLTLKKLFKPDEDHDTPIDAGAGRTFESQRRSSWSHNSWGG